jgi:hypothetical protein
MRQTGANMVFMRRVSLCFFVILIMTLPVFGTAQGNEGARSPQTSPNYAAAFPPVQNPATADQIREYLRQSGDMEKYRTHLINSVDSIRSVGKPYWPESFWTSIKDEMRKDDMMPMFIVLFRHGISRELMQETLDAYHRLGADHFAGSPQWVKIEEAKRAMSPDTQKLMLIETQATIERVYQVYKPQIKAARAKYMAEHPDYKEN